MRGRRRRRRRRRRQEAACSVLSDKGAGGQAAARESGGRPLGGRLPGLERFGGALSMLLRSLRSLRTAPASQLSMLAALAAPEPLKPGASHARCGLTARAFANLWCPARNACHGLCRSAPRRPRSVSRVASGTVQEPHATAVAGKRLGRSNGRRRSLARGHTPSRSGAPRIYSPKSLSPGWSSGRRPIGQRNRRALSAMGASLMLACRCVISPSALNCQFSLP
jgi:hypothetical protein